MLKVKEIYEFGARLAIFENGDAYISTKGNIHIIEDKQIIDDRAKTLIEIDETNVNGKCYYSEEEMETIGNKEK